jgi:hypothetical protein
MSNQPPYLPTALGASKTTLLLSNNPSSGPYAWQLPQCNITSNPYGGGTGTTGLFSCVAINYGAVSIVVWFYLPPGGQGVLVSIEDQQYPNEHYQVPLLYVGTNGYLYASDWNGAAWQVSTPISFGWHMAVFEEWAASTSGPYYLALYLDGSLVGQTSSSSGTVLFNIDSGNYPMSYSDIGSGYAPSSNWPNVNNAWFFFNGAIAYVALYNRVLTTSDVLAIYQGVRITSGLVAEYVGNNYNSSTGVWTDSSGNNYNITTTVVAGQYPPRGCTLWPTGDSGNWINWPTC